MSIDKFSIDDESVNRILEGIKNINSKKLTDTGGVELEPYIQDLIPWIRNLDPMVKLAMNPPSAEAIARTREKWGITGKPEWEK
tara:strand:- start:32 stop:283 length:252 start_codon:yes stop_codon:yes gene_type:complete